MTEVKDLMTKDVITISKNNTVLEAAQLMGKKGVGCLVIKDEEKPIGIVTERDFVNRVVAKSLPLDTEVSKIMSKPLITIDPDRSLREAARLMIDNKLRKLPVVKDGKLEGIITAADFAKQIGRKTITEEILEAIARYPPTYPYI